MSAPSHSGVCVVPKRLRLRVADESGHAAGFEAWNEHSMRAGLARASEELVGLAVPSHQTRKHSEAKEYRVMHLHIAYEGKLGPWVNVMNRQGNAIAVRHPMSPLADRQNYGEILDLSRFTWNHACELEQLFAPGSSLVKAANDEIDRLVRQKQRKRFKVIKGLTSRRAR